MGSVPKCFCVSQILLCPEKFVLNIYIAIKAKILTH